MKERKELVAIVAGCNRSSHSGGYIPNHVSDFKLIGFGGKSLNGQ